jgi:predicted phage terminase large subunit-like protein
MELPELLKFVPTHIDALSVKIKITKVEPKASGKSLVQMIRRYTGLNIAEITSPFVGYSKIERARAASPYVESGRVILVRGPWNEHFLHQVATFPNAKHDEYIDLTSYAIEEELIGSGATGKYNFV